MEKTDKKNLDIEINNLEKEYDELRLKLSDIYDKIIDLELKKFDLDKFNGQYIKYQEDETITHYMLVDWIYDSNRTSCHFEKTFRGVGFSHEFTGYHDATWCEFSYMLEFRISDNSEKGFKNEIDKIEIITKEEFSKEFNKMQEMMSKYFSKYGE